MSNRATTVRSLGTGPALLGLLGVAAAAGGLAQTGPMWVSVGGLALIALYLVDSPVVTVVFAHVALVAAGTPSPFTLLVVEGGLFFVLFSTALATPNGWTTGFLTTAIVPALAGLAWLSLTRFRLSPLVVGATLLAGVAVASYLLHRYLLVDLDVVTGDESPDRDFT